MRKDIKASCQERPSRIEGQVRGLSKMVDKDRDCIDITQISAVRAARGASRRKCSESMCPIASNTQLQAGIGPISARK